ncbi:SAP domain-containing protein [Staphylococcus saprophyticus]|nr:SAP domain-containing protein [Staphylococcus saprophyticus]
MELNVNDLLVLHFNIGRIVGSETTNFYYFRENNINVKNHLNKLIERDFLIINSNPEVALPKLTIPELKEILRTNNLKLGGKKQELVNRILENIDAINLESFDLPSIYEATDKGKRTLDDTLYIKHFYNDYLVSMPRAFKIATTDLNSKDKIEYIYMTEIKYEMSVNNDSHRLSGLFNALATYYKTNKNNNELARQYYNVGYYTSVKSELNSLTRYFNHTEISENVSLYRIEPNFKMEELYEQLIYVDNTSDELLQTLFIKDVQNFYSIDEELALNLINYIIARIKKENQESKANDIFEYANLTANTNESSNYSSEDNFLNENIDIKTNTNIDTNKENPNKTKVIDDEVTNNSDALKGCGCLIFIILFISGCSMLVF